MHRRPDYMFWHLIMYTGMYTPLLALILMP